MNLSMYIALDQNQ